jgi:cysteine desulfurase
MQQTKTKRIYLDSAATTRTDPEVLEAMMPWLSYHYGNPSAQYSYGREARVAIETSRKQAAALLGVDPDCLTFTSGGTEANNMAIAAAVQQLGCTHILYNPLEHHSVLHAIQYYAKGSVTSYALPLRSDGLVDSLTLESQLMDHRRAGQRCLVCVMHSNNETGLMTDIVEVGTLCRRYDAIYLADCVCSIGHYRVNLGALPVDLATAAAHKFHGPKGIGLLYARSGLAITPLLHGGGQERNRRAGTENVAGIIGLTRALVIADRDHQADSTHIRSLRDRLLQGLQLRIPSARLNSHPVYGLYTVLNISLPRTAGTEALLLELDLAGICVSSGRACHAGAPSHVMAALGRGDDVTLRFSFCKYNTAAEIDRVLAVLQQKLIPQSTLLSTGG